MDKHYTYSRLTPLETPAFRELITLFGEVFGEPETYHRQQPSEVYLKRLLERDTFLAIIARREGRIIAGLTAYVLDKFEQERREIYIYDLAVLENHRRRKVATGLIGYLQTIAREIGAYLIFVQADWDDLPPIRLYESLGTREDIHHFDIPCG